MYLVMQGLIPGKVTMKDRLQNFGYCEAEGAREAQGAGSWLLKPGEKVRGHEFHYSQWDGEGLAPACIARRRRIGSERPEGYASPLIHASYVHVHFHGCPWFARRFVRTAARFAKEVKNGIDAFNGARGRGLSDAAAVRAGSEHRRDCPASALPGG
jgi:cobyrinic acid a,c-diamide synthase